jgi:DNA-binding NarL/FixJ family response regulator
VSYLSQGRSGDPADPATIRAPASKISPQTPCSTFIPFEALTPREAEVLPLIAAGLSNTEIAKHLSTDSSRPARTTHPASRAPADLT